MSAQDSKVVRNYLYNVSYQILMTVLPIITLPYITRVIGSENLGIARYVESVAMLFTTFGMLGLTWYANRAIAYHRSDKESLSSCFYEIFLMRILLLAGTAAVYFTVLSGSEYRLFYQIYFLYVAGTFLDVGWFFTGIEDLKPVTIRNFIIRILSTIMLFVLVRSREDLGNYFWLTCGTTFINAIVMIPWTRKYVQKVPLKKLHVFSHFLPAIALFLPQAATQIYIQCDKMMIKHMLVNPSFVSFYSENEKIAKIPIVLVSALSTVLMPRIAYEFKEGNQDNIRSFVKNAFGFTILLLFPCCTGLMAIAKDFVPFFLGPEFAETYPILIMFCPAMIFIGLSNVTGIQYLVALNRIPALTVSYVTAAISNLIINYLLIPGMGVYGAIAGTLFAEALVFLIQYRYVAKDVGNVLKGIPFFRLGALSAATGAAAYLVRCLPISRLPAMLLAVLAGIAVYGAGVLKMRIVTIKDRKIAVDFSHGDRNE